MFICRSYSLKIEIELEMKLDINWFLFPAKTEEDDEAVSASAARHDGSSRYDACSGVVCPPLDCPTRPYIPAGQCCPICPSAPAETVRPTQRSTRPELQVDY